MNRTKYIPSIVMLAAAFVACVSTIYFKYTTREILYIVLIISVCFFGLGHIIRMIAEKYLVVETIEEMKSEESEEESDKSESKQEKDEKQ
ncbi:MAG: hypothetical protein IJA34_08895 [Lachnospiraceae bacterium]|nr:hypothetical protein [Lachnospiraceae bacterium]